MLNPKRGGRYQTNTEGEGRTENKGSNQGAGSRSDCPPEAETGNSQEDRVGPNAYGSQGSSERGKWGDIRPLGQQLPQT